MTRRPTTPLSVLDLALVEPGGSRTRAARAAVRASVELAQAAERLGYRRVWYAEHHSMASIASSAPAVLVAHVAAHTSTIRLGAGGVMLPNHSPLAVAEQFGTLAAAHSGRIDLGLGRAPGSDGATSRALRRDPLAADSFAEDVVELQAFLAGRSDVPGVEAVPHALDDDGLPVPLYVLGSSMFGARLAALLGLPYAFASHFAPDLLEPAVAAYRRDFRPAGGPGQLEEPYVLAGATVFAADTEQEARRHLLAARRQRAVTLFGRGRVPTALVADPGSDPAAWEAAADALLEAGAGVHVDAMMRLAVVGDADGVAAGLDAFAVTADADELVTVHAAPTHAARLRSLELAAPQPAVVAVA